MLMLIINKITENTKSRLIAVMQRCLYFWEITNKALTYITVF